MTLTTFPLQVASAFPPLSPLAALRQATGARRGARATGDVTGGGVQQRRGAAPVFLAAPRDLGPCGGVRAFAMPVFLCADATSGRLISRISLASAEETLEKTGVRFIPRIDRKSREGGEKFRGQSERERTTNERGRGEVNESYSRSAHTGGLE